MKLLIYVQTVLLKRTLFKKNDYILKNRMFCFICNNTIPYLRVLI